MVSDIANELIVHSPASYPARVSSVDQIELDSLDILPPSSFFIVLELPSVIWSEQIAEPVEHGNLSEIF